MSKTVFLHFSDIHYNSVYDSAFMSRLTDKTGINLTQQLFIGLEHMSHLCPRPDFILLSGDLVHEGTVAEYRKLRGFIESAFPEARIFAVPGNHDGQAYSEGWHGNASSTCYYEQTLPAGLRLIALDSRGGKYGSGRIDEGQLRWLRDALSRDSRVPCVLLMHHTPHVSGQEEFLVWQMENARELREAVQSANILGIFTGHTHMRYESALGSIPCHTAASIGYEIDALEDRMILRNRSGYNLCSCEDGVLAVRQIKVPSPVDISVSVPYSELC